MNTSKHVVVILIAIALGAGSFVATYAWPPSTSSASSPDATATTTSCGEANECRCLALWLQLSPEETAKLASGGEPFFKERPKLEAALYAERRKLADLFENEDAADNEILEQVERVIAANSALERCVASYLVGLRHQLTEKQRDRLYRRCARGVRDAGGCRWRYRDSQNGCGGCGAGPQEKGNCKMKGCGKATINVPAPCKKSPTCRSACQKQ